MNRQRIRTIALDLLERNNRDELAIWALAAIDDAEFAAIARLQNEVRETRKLLEASIENSRRAIALLEKVVG